MKVQISFHMYRPSYKRQYHRVNKQQHEATRSTKLRKRWRSCKYIETERQTNPCTIGEDSEEWLINAEVLVFGFLMFLQSLWTLESAAPVGKNNGSAIRAENQAACAMQPRQTTKIDPEIDSKSCKITSVIIRNVPSASGRDTPEGILVDFRERLSGKDLSRSSGSSAASGNFGFPGFFANPLAGTHQEGPPLHGPPLDYSGLR